MNKLFLNGKIIGVPQMLDGREARAYVQRQILEQCKDFGGLGLVCFTLNAPGPIKVNFLMDVAFYSGVEVIGEALGKMRSADEGAKVKSFILEHEYGHEAYFPLKEQTALDAKKVLTEIEETHPFGRLFDIDVLRPDGSKVSRTEIGYEERRCIICGEPVARCAAQRIHSVRELQQKTWSTIYEGIKAEGSHLNHIVISRLAHMAMSFEVATTPKPGLVDFENNGSHDDMDAETFGKSIDAISGYFGKCFDAGKDATKPEEILQVIRPLGIKADADMLEATDGVNTYGGLIFSLGIIASAIGYVDGKDEKLPLNIEEILDAAAGIAKPTLSEKAAGARLEAASGFPLLKNVALPSLKKALDKDVDINAAGVWTLLKIIAAADDTNMIKRGGIEGAEWAKNRAAEVAKEFETALDNNYPPEMMKACYDLFLNKVKKLDEEFIEKNLSPGGAADILAVAYFITFAQDFVEG